MKGKLVNTIIAIIDENDAEINAYDSNVIEIKFEEPVKKITFDEDEWYNLVHILNKSKEEARHAKKTKDINNSCMLI